MKKSMACFCLAFLFALHADRLVFSQQGLGIGRLSGKVTDDNGNPIQSVRISIQSVEDIADYSDGTKSIEINKNIKPIETVTDAKGEWSISLLERGLWKITATAAGYDPASGLQYVSEISGRPKMIMRLFKIGTSSSKERPTYLLEKADEFYYLNKYDEAISLYRQYIAQDPEAVMVRLKIGDCYVEKSDLEKAILEFQDIAAAMSKDSRDKVIAARALAGIGECRFKKRELDQAQEYFKRSLDMYPEDEVVAYNLAEILFSVRKTVEAIRFFTMATQISPYWSDPYYKLGNAYIHIADYEKAKDAFKQFLKIEPGSPRAAGVKKILDDLDKIKK